MTNKIYSSVLVLFMMVSITVGGTVQAYLSTCSFNVPGKGPYLETYLSVDGKGLSYVKKENGKYQGAIEVTLLVKHDTTWVYRDRYNLLSPEVDDTSKYLKDFIDQQRIPLANGDYDLSISITDKNKREHPFAGKAKIYINYPDTVPAISDIELLASFTKSVQKNILTKNGYDLTPYIDNFYSHYNNKIKFYAEVYNSKYLASDKYLVKYYIEQYKTKRIMGEFSQFIKMIPEDINVVMAELPIDSLVSGNYNLVIEVRNKKDELMAMKELFFQRENPNVRNIIKASDYAGFDINSTFVRNYNNRDTLYEMLLCLRPISSQTEIEFVDNYFQKDSRNKDTLLMKKYFYDFWAKRNSDNPKEEWLKYRAEVIKVNEKWGNVFRKGYESDRGRVYLQYGPPDIIVDGTDDPAAKPYEIWEYYKLADKTHKIPDQTYKRFLFYEPNQGNNEFVLLHSDVKGEISDEKWQLVLYQRSYQSTDIDDVNAPTYAGSRALDLFNNPR